MYVIGLLLAAINFTALLAVFLFLVLLWRRTSAFGFVVLAALLVFSAIYPWLATYARGFIPSFEQMFYGSSLNMVLGLVLSVVTAFAWWNIYVRISQLMLINSSKPQPLRSAG